METVEGKEAAIGAPPQGGLFDGAQNDKQGDEKIPKPTNEMDVDHQKNAEPDAAGAPQDPQGTTSAAANPAPIIDNPPAHAAAHHAEPLKADTTTIPAPTNPSKQEKGPSSLNLGQQDPSMVSPFEIAPPPGIISTFSKPVQVLGQTSQPTNSSLDSAGSASRRHHLLRHTLPAELVGENAVHHFGVTNVEDALRSVQRMSQRDLQQAFERVYNVKSSSNNNNWLRKKLVEALVPKDGPSTGDGALDAILDEIMTKGPSSKKRSKETTAYNMKDAYGGGSGGMSHPPSYQHQPQPKQRKPSVVHPSPLDTYPGYHHPDDHPSNAAGDEDTGLTSGGRRKRRAAAGVAAATAAVLRDPALEEIEKADLQRAASGEYQDRRWGTGSNAATAAAVTAAARGGRQVHSGGARYGRGAAPSHHQHRHHHAAGANHHNGPGAGDQQQQHAIANALQTLTHLLSIAVQQGKVNSNNNNAAGLAAALGALGANSNGNNWGSAPGQYLQHLQQQQQYYQQQQQMLKRPPPPAPPAPAAVDPLVALQRLAAGAGNVGPDNRTNARAQLVEALTASGIFGNLGGQRPAPAQIPQPPPPALAPAPAPVAPIAPQPVPPGQQTSATLERLLAALSQSQAAQTAPMAPPPQQQQPVLNNGSSNPSASELLQRALSAHAAAHQQSVNPRPPAQGQQQQPDQPAPAPAAAAAAAGNPGGNPSSSSLPATIPGSDFPMDSILMQLLQQQAEVQITANLAPP